LAVAGGWRKVDTKNAEPPLGRKSKKRPGGKRTIAHTVIERINAPRRRLLRLPACRAATLTRTALRTR
jgi:hypothetical protein